MSAPINLTNESLSPGTTTFTLERVRNQLRHDTYLFDRDTPERGIPSPFICEGLEYELEGAVHRYYTKPEQNERRERLCLDLYQTVLSSESHCPRLDDLFSKIVLCNLQVERTDDISERAYNLLTRLPARPIELPELPTVISPDYLTHVSPPREENSSANATLWHQLQVTSYVSANVIRTAILLVIYPGSASGMLQNFVDTTAKLLETASTLSSLADSGLARQRWFIVRAFLWTAWQRCTMFYFYSILDRYLKSGFNDQDEQSRILRGMRLSPGLSIQEMSKSNASLGKPQYMCGWPFELLRSDSICIGVDFRRFFLRYSMALATEEAAVYVTTTLRVLETNRTSVKDSRECVLRTNRPMMCFAKIIVGD